MGILVTSTRAELPCCTTSLSIGATEREENWCDLPNLYEVLLDLSSLTCTSPSTSPVEVLDVEHSKKSDVHFTDILTGAHRALHCGKDQKHFVARYSISWEVNKVCKESWPAPYYAKRPDLPSEGHAP